MVSCANVEGKWLLYDFLRLAYIMQGFHDCTEAGSRTTIFWFALLSLIVVAVATAQQ